MPPRRATKRGARAPEGGLTWKRLSRLVRFMTRQDLVEVEIEDGATKIHVRRREAAPSVRLPEAPLPAAAPAASRGPAGPPPSSRPSEEGAVELRSPMVGTFYRSPGPEADAFVRKGDVVEPDTVVAIIEAMKVMNEIRAEIGGEISEILVENGEPVEFGQPLFRIRPRS